jgi:tRNA (guanine-N7-)-methyltransferase
MIESKPPSRFYGRRLGRPLRLRKTALMDTLLPKLTLAVPGQGGLNLASIFLHKPTQFWLEIGFGGGEHLAAQAVRNPEIGFLGCEPFRNGIASLLDHIEARQIPNIRIYADDARHVLDALPDASLDRCFVLFADPWPKARHAKRRFIGVENIPRLSRVLKPNAELRLATDDAQLAEWMTEHMRASMDFAEVFHTSSPPTDWVPTRYEHKAIKVGRMPVYMGYERRR